MKVPSLNKRSMERFDLRLPVELTPDMEYGKQTSLKLMTKDICAGGAFIKTGKQFLTGSKVKIVITLPLDRFKDLHTPKAFITVKGNVLRSNKSGMAIRFSRRYQHTAIP